ncbi:MAG: glycoside hydrolase family 16 protein [Sphingobacteriales bacterium]|nr:MAG: glycoside hydrolase family 16 protein [Sphingobacteriales bacterium]
MKTIRLLVFIPFAFSFLIGSIVFSGCKGDDFQKLEARNWSLVWSDEFNGEAGTSPDSTKWTYDIGTGQNGWGNQELQYYTDRSQNVSMDGEGNLVITAIKELYAGSGFTSARLNTKGLFEQTYGRFEARLKTPYGPGIWPAFWLLGSNIETVNWPQCGEIDIMELRGQHPQIINGTLHGPGYSGGNSITGAYGLENDRYDSNFHTFAVEWFPDRIDFFVDDYLYQRIEPNEVNGEWVYDHPFFMILNVAVGGNYVGFPTEQTPFPQKMIIDYIRVYNEAN